MYPKDEEINETRKLVGENYPHAYDRSKALGQLEILKGVDKGLDAVIVNPTGVIGPFDYKMSRMGSVVLDLYNKKMPALCDGGYNWVDVRDVCDGAIAAAEKGITGESYLLGGHWKSQKTIAEVVSTISGNKPPSLVLSSRICLIASYFSVAWAALMRKTPLFTPYAIETLQGHRYISCEKAQKETRL